MLALYAFDALLFLALLFFLFLPISDRRTVRMRLCVICIIAASLAASFVTIGAPQVQVASAARER